METHDVAKELSELRKEVYEARSLVIKTDNLLKTLHAELKAVDTRQTRYERQHLIGHVGAYVVFGLVVALGAWYYTRSAVEAERQLAADLTAEARALKSEAEVAKSTAETSQRARDLAARESLAVYRLLRDEDAGKRAEGLDRLAALDPKDLDPFARLVLADAEGGLREQAARDAHEAGIALYRRGKMSEAVGALETFAGHAVRLDAGWEPSLRLQADYYLGAARHQTGDKAGALEPLRRYVDGSSRGSTRAYAALLLGDVLEADGKKSEARAAYQAGLEADPKGKSAENLRNRLERLGGVAPAPQD